MHDIKAIRDNPEAFDQGLDRRGLPAQSAALLALDEKRRKALTRLQEAQSRRNAASNPRGGDASRAAASISASGRAALRAATSSRLVAMMRSRTVDMVRLRCDPLLARGRAEGKGQAAQSIGDSPRAASQRLTAEKGRCPRNPRCADRGEGWGAATTRCPPGAA